MRNAVCRLALGRNGPSPEPCSEGRPAETRRFCAHGTTFSCAFLLVYSAALSQELCLKGGDVAEDEIETQVFSEISAKPGALYR